MPQQGTRINPAQRMTVRLVLASGATVAMLIGAQTLASAGHASPVNNVSTTSNGQSGFSTNSDDNTNWFGQDDQSSNQYSVQAAANQPNPFTRSSR